MDLSFLDPWGLIVAGGFGVGFLVGITGVGAGSLMTPFLIHMHINPIVAVGTDLLFACITKASAAWRHHSFGNVDWRIVRWLATGSLPGAAAMLAWLYLVQPDTKLLAMTIREVLALALVISAIAVALYPWLKKKAEHAPDAQGPETLRRMPTFLLGVLLGILVALTSVGAGAIGVVVLTVLYHWMPARRLIGTDIVHAIPLTFVSGLSHLGMGNVDLKVLAFLLIGSIPGIAMGSRVTGKIPDWLLRIVLSLVLLWAAYSLVHKVL